MQQTPVPVTVGSSSAITLDAGPIRVTYARFPAHGEIPAHAHDRACIPVMLSGSFDLSFRGRPAIQCDEGTTAVEPVGDCHCNRMGTAGAVVLVLQPDASVADSHRDLHEFLDGIRLLRRPDLHGLGLRMAGEVADPDPFTTTALEGMALELMARAARAARTRERVPPPWLRRAEDMLRARHADPLTIADVARECRVHPAHLSRTFRAHFGVSVGEFVRMRRVEWAAGQLRATTAPIAEIATRAGFSDQSHFTRRFRERMGATPERWRRIHSV